MLPRLRIAGLLPLGGLRVTAPVAPSRLAKVSLGEVHYDGYGDDEDAWVGADEICSKLLKAAPVKAEALAKVLVLSVGVSTYR